jgi:hypothetical protein
VRIFKNAWFNRFAKKENIADDELKAIVSDLENGLWDAAWAAGSTRCALPVPARESQAIVFFKSGERAFFAFGFAKSARDNITGKELRSLKDTAKEDFRMTEEQMKERLIDGSFVEIV